MDTVIKQVLGDLSCLYHDTKGIVQMTTRRLWIPGNGKVDQRDILLILQGAAKKEVTGFTGRVYSYYNVPMYQQEYEQHWLGIDIDAKDNPSLEASKVISILPEASVRYSKSGVGLHCLFKLEEPVRVQVGRKLNCSNALRVYRNRLIENGIVPCSAHSLNFWLLGGKQRWLSRTENTIKIETKVEAARVGVESGAAWILETFEPKAKRLLDRLMDKKVIHKSDLVYSKYQIVSKHVFKALKDTEFEFKTCSTMQNDEYNGFLSCNGVNLNLFICADNKCVLEVNAGFPEVALKEG